ncbi:MAG: acyl-CoA thioesterase [Bacteroidetes bacterium]|nr:acyl-CoA thioesterase [Bacteroidota bacterium]
MEETKKVSDSFTRMTQFVLPNDTNTLNNLRGGRLLHWMDLAAAIAAQKHSSRIVVTASVDNVSFDHPIHLGDVVTIDASVTRSFNTSIEIYLEVWAENIPSKTRYRSNEAFYTFVALNEKGKPTHVPNIEAETETEKLRYKAALARRELRLVLAGRMKASESEGVKHILGL